MAATEASRQWSLVGGVAVYNEEGRIERSLRSLLDQELPTGFKWSKVWVVASGCTDQTTEVVRALSERDPRIGLVVEPKRNGKASALDLIFQRAEGDFLVLLDGDSVAAPGALKALWETARDVVPPFAVMGRPTPPSDPEGEIYPEVELLYRLHHEYHDAVLSRGEGTHLAENLMLLSLGEKPALPRGIVNDGTFLAHRVLQRGGRLLYAPDAEVILKIPLRLSDHIAQRRRILWGHWQVRDLTGIEVTTLQTHARTSPREAWRIVARSVGATQKGVRSLLVLLTAEVVALALARWDRVPPRRNHSIWIPIRGSAPRPGRRSLEDGRISRSRAPSDRAG